MRILRLLLMTVVLLVVWFLGGHLFHKHWWVIDNLFGEGCWENTFAPVSALFAAFASGGAIYAIIVQIRQFRSQQFESNFMNLLNIYKSNKESLTVHIGKKETRGIDVFYDSYMLLKEIYTRVKCPDFSGGIFQPNSKSEYIIGARIDDLRNDYGVIEWEGRERFKLCHKTLEECLENSLGKYFRHLYHTVKYVDKMAPNSRKKKLYIGILRAQFDNYEYALIYYNTLMSNDKKVFKNTSKFQHLIERYCLLHNLNQRLLFDGHDAGRYSDKAFWHFWRRMNKKYYQSWKKNVWEKCVTNFKECFIPQFE
ncbi:hypothetical protein GO013_12740 [Pseudodesulfovibrio sp. JC047]|uniref:putative phage abortive infection protein n=1 Tax=Pseudodesulfovibrio sp. JC047 TaxID=2683199 RepID=UPI0013D19A95|nr:putative phage abortive infection protein [Pseudodesulfovibrio sp. JC047]NDV20277.1 hypothetical protein [Pseudodesulfovibrio sp. JC047]